MTQVHEELLDTLETKNGGWLLGLVQNGENIHAFQCFEVASGKRMYIAVYIEFVCV